MSALFTFVIVSVLLPAPKKILGSPLVLIMDPSLVHDIVGPGSSLLTFLIGNSSSPASLLRLLIVLITLVPALTHALPLALTLTLEPPHTLALVLPLT